MGFFIGSNQVIYESENTLFKLFNTTFSTA